MKASFQRFPLTFLTAFLSILLVASNLRADGPGDNIATSVRPVPPIGVAIEPNLRAELMNDVQSLGKEIEDLRSSLRAKPALLDLLPDVQIYHNAVRYALTHDEFFKPQEAEAARNLLAQGKERANELRNGTASWTTKTGLVVRGYRSRIDQSIQPFGLVIPEGYKPNSKDKWRLDCWFHGRNETLSEVNFLTERNRNKGELVTDKAIVLHLYGRYCNANKFAGEVDLFEALERVKKLYPIDNDRVLVRGFSMGGAACWQFATHFAGEWAAAAPGAGFSETADFLKVFQNETLQPTWYEQKLWNMYDATAYAVNLFNCPTVAYSGEVDRQRQAAVMMEKALAQEYITLTHIIGPNTGHSYEPNSKKQINTLMDAFAESGRINNPQKVRFTTWTLRYNKMKWITIDSLNKHWVRARIDAERRGDDFDIQTKNVAAFTISVPTNTFPRTTPSIFVNIDGDLEITLPFPTGKDFKAHFRRVNGMWKRVDSPLENKLIKRHGLQGPIDDAFMDSFIIVKPTGTPLNPKVEKWVNGEMQRAITEWRRHFRGEAIVKKDTEITPQDIANSNLVVWGDPQSNEILKRTLKGLGLKWDDTTLQIGGASFSSSTHVPVMIYPNPLNTKRYIVLNSGFTYREYDYLNNARQTPKLPDWAIVDLSTPPNSRYPGKVVDAGFFNEYWQWTPERGK